MNRKKIHFNHYGFTVSSDDFLKKNFQGQERRQSPRLLHGSWGWPTSVPDAVTSVSYSRVTFHKTGTKATLTGTEIMQN